MCLGTDCEPEDLDRRSFLAGGAAAIAGIALGAPRVTAQEEKPPPTRVLDDPTVVHGAVRFKSGDNEIGGYLARPKAAGDHPAVLVVAGNKISEEYIPNTCAALAVAGYVGLAPDIWHILPEGATRAEVEEALEGHTDEHFLADIKAGADFLRGHEAVRPGPMGILGFCSGGRRALLHADRYESIAAVVPFHPAKTTPGEVSKLKAPVRIHTGTADRVVPVDEVRELEKVLRAQGTPVELFVYEGADHGFLAYTRPYYKPEHAKLAWKRTVEFLDDKLKK